jgi:hypothetical protein
MKIPVSLLAALGLASLSSAATFRMWDPTPYRSQLDSPFYEGIHGNTIFVEDFEDGSLNTPFVRDPLTFPRQGISFRTQNPTIPDRFVASVDGDDGDLDLNGNLGDSWITFEDGGAGQRSFFAFDFLPNPEGQYPLFVGIVVTEIADIDSEVNLGIFGEEGRNLANDAEFDPRDWFDGNRRGDVETHRFIGFYAEEGIRRISGSNTFQVDHLQYGYAIPEPSTTALSLIATSLGLLRRKRGT